MANQYKNKVIYNGQTLIDLTGVTVTPQVLSQGYTAIDASGAPITGTMSGGGTGAVVVTEEQLSGGGIAKHITAVDISDTTAVASDVASGKYFYTADGTKTEGTSSGGSITVNSLSVTQNGTYTAPTGTAYSPVTVNVSGSSWTKVAETTYTISTSSTTSELYATFETGHSELWTSEKIVYVRIRDTAGKRNGYFYGTDWFKINSIPINNGSATYTTMGSLINVIRVESDSKYTQAGGTGYGIYPNRFYDNGDIDINTRYGTYSLTINGTYSVEVYLLDPPTGAPIYT